MLRHYWMVVREEPVIPRRRNPRCPQDLEAICLKCLEKASARRYATADELAADLRRFLAGEPTQARPLSKVQRGCDGPRRIVVSPLCWPRSR